MAEVTARRRLAPLLLCLALLFGSVSCWGQQAGVTVAGSTSVQPFADLLAEEYMHIRPDLTISVQGGGSSAGIQAALTGVAQIGMSSRELKGEERQLVAIEIAKDAIAVVVHPSNPLTAMTLEQVRDIFAGRHRSWAELDGPARPIHLVTREEGSGTRGAFQELIMAKDLIDASAIVQDSSGAVRQLVADAPTAIGYISAGLVNETVREVSIDGVAPTVENVRAGRYRLVRPFLFLTREEPAGELKQFIDFVLSPQGRQFLTAEGLVTPQ